MPRAETTGRRLIAAMATAALSMMRLMIIAVTSFGTGDLVGGDPGDFPGQLLLARQRGFGRIDANFVIAWAARFLLVLFVHRANFTDPSREKGRKRFFFEKRTKKLFLNWAVLVSAPPAQSQRSFCAAFSKKRPSSFSVLASAADRPYIAADLLL